MSKIQASDDLEMYSADSLTELINFKWCTYAYNWHFVGCCFHFFYLFILNIYIFRIYIHDPDTKEHDETIEHSDEFWTSMDPDKYRQRQTIILFFGVIYSLLYEISEVVNTGFLTYYSFPSNFVDGIYIVCNFMNIGLQWNRSQYDLMNVIVLIFILDITIVKSFSFIRIFSQFSPIVTMLRIVYNQLNNFMIFFMMLIF